MTYLSFMKKCVICGKDFEAKRADAKICSSQCRQKAKRAGIRFRGESVLATPLGEEKRYKPANKPVLDKFGQIIVGAKRMPPKIESKKSIEVLYPKEPITIDLYMGHEIPKGLKGIDLSIWKAEIKEKNKPV